MLAWLGTPRKPGFGYRRRRDEEAPNTSVIGDVSRGGVARASTRTDSLALDTRPRKSKSQSLRESSLSDRQIRFTFDRCLLTSSLGYDHWVSFSGTAELDIHRDRSDHDCGIGHRWASHGRMPAWLVGMAHRLRVGCSFRRTE